MLDPLLPTELDRPWSARDGETVREMVARAHRIAARLAPDGRRIVLACKHAQAFVPGLFGAWLAGATVELLPNTQAGTLDRVDGDPGVAYVLHDVADRRARSAKAIFVPEIEALPAIAAPAAAPPAPAVVLSTSGTTEAPRYVGKTLAQLVDESAALAGVFPAARCVMSTVPLSHLYGLTFGVVLALRGGARIVSHDALLPGDVAACLAREDVDFLVSTPAHLRAMVSAAMPRGLRVLSSAARMPADLARALVAAHAWHVTDLLGSTETGAFATRDATGGAWRPLPGVTVSAPDGKLAVASAWAGGARVELDDRIELTADGGFHHVGRASELLKIAGKRAATHAIEATVRAVPGVADAAIVVHDAPGKEPRTALAIVAAPGATPARDAIAAAIRHDFDAVFVPRIVKLVPHIPRNERGKLDPAALRAALGLASDHIALHRVADGRYTAALAADLIFFRGHFAAQAILPGAVLIDRVVWAAARAEWPALGGLRGLRRLRFHKPVFAGQALAVNLTLRDARVMFEVSCGDDVVASGQLVVD
ncbi:MAG TPA: AMP-binding protein [Kofleriaceae bacterium]|nr:AMP-binding protein [Kofleriaceae bacterium]